MDKEFDRELTRRFLNMYQRADKKGKGEIPIIIGIIFIISIPPDSPICPLSSYNPSVH